jgi:AraC-like DNA-binding protein
MTGGLDTSKHGKRPGPRQEVSTRLDLNRLHKCGSLHKQVLSAINRTDHRISIVLDYLSAQEPARIPTIGSLAVSLNLSPSRLRSIFRTHSGIPLSRYIKHLRLHRGRMLLQQTLLTVKQVIAEIGLVDHSHFARDYKRLFGESPSVTRRGQAQVNTALALSRHQTVNLATDKGLHSGSPVLTIGEL